jgi:hypothetical protein
VTLGPPLDLDIDIVDLAPSVPRPAPGSAPLAEVAFRRTAWLPEEVRILRTVYVKEGVDAALEFLPGRTRQATYVHANSLGIKSEHRPTRRGIYRALATEALELRRKGLSCTAIGRELGMCEATATNAVLFAECIEAGHEPLERGPDGRISPAGRARLRGMLAQGLKHRDIQVQCGISASRITYERKLYERELEEAGLAPLPPPGNGERYSGVPVDAAARKLVEGLFLEGFGTAKINERTGISKTSCVRIRARLIKRLKRSGRCLPGCDINGKRRGRLKESLHYNHPKQFERLEELLEAGWTVLRAAAFAGMNRIAADRYVHARRAAGVIYPKREWRGRPAPAVQAIPNEWRARFRQLLADRDFDEARKMLFGEMGVALEPSGAGGGG